MRFDLTDLRLLLNIVETGSITRGAERTNMALASASERVRGMEEVAGVPLLSRLQRGVEVTPAGHAVARHARLILAQVEKMRGELGEHAAGLKGRVRVLGNTAALTELLPSALPGFLAANPNMDVDVEEWSSPDIVAALREGVADIGIVSDAVDLSGLTAVPLAEDRLVAVLPSSHRLAAAASLRLADIADEDFIGLSPGSALQDYLALQASRMGKALTLRVRLKGFDAICRMVEAGVGVAIVPAASLARRAPAQGLKAVELADGWAARRLTLCFRSLDELPLPARRLVEHLTP